MNDFESNITKITGETFTQRKERIRLANLKTQKRAEKIERCGMFVACVFIVLFLLVGLVVLAAGLKFLLGYLF